MHLFYTPDINTSTYTLSEEESKHCIRVLRLVEGDKIYLVDGRGGFYETHIIEAHPKRCMVQVLDVKLNYGKRNYRLHMAISPLKSLDRFEWFLEKATEIGIDEITPIITQRSEKRDLKFDRINAKRIEKSNRKNEKRLAKGKSPKQLRLKNKEKPTFRESVLEAGEPPVILDTFLTKITKNQLQKFVFSKGYFDSEVSDSLVLDVKNKRAKSYYFISKSKPYYIRNINYKIENSLN